jgi:TRAP-type uncharacterized transport system substrate-binding protein
MAGKKFIQANWHFVTTAVITSVILGVVLLVLDTMPPRELAMATGPEGSGYGKLGKQYQEALARAGERLRLVETAGSVENLALLRDPGSGVTAALIQDGTVGKEEDTRLESLGTVLRASLGFPPW